MMHIFPSGTYTAGPHRTDAHATAEAFPGIRRDAELRLELPTDQGRGAPRAMDRWGWASNDSG